VEENVWEKESVVGLCKVAVMSVDILNLS